MSKTSHKVISKSGGLTIPADIRREYSLMGGDAVDITVDDNGRLVIAPHTPRCMVCQGQDNVRKFRDKYICMSCVGSMVMEVGTE